MKSVDILIHAITLFSGAATALLGLLLYLKYRIKTIGYYALFIFATTFTVATTTVYSYLSFYKNSGSYNLLQVVPFLLFEVFIFFINYTFTLFSMGITGRPFKTINKIFAFFPCLFILLSVISIIFRGGTVRGIPIPPEMMIFFSIILLSLFITFITYSIFIALNLKNISNADLKRALKIMALIIIVFIPIQTLIIVFNRETFVIMLSRNIFYLLINIISIIFAAKYFFIETPSIMDKIEVSPNFMDKYSITSREREVIEYVLSGLSIKEISGKLGRSFKTINNHIYNIYEKTGVSNKIELLNLIRENRLQP